MEPFSHISPMETGSLEDPIIIDVRTPQEFNEGHIEGSILIPIGGKEFQDALAKLDKTKRYLIYCRSGSRSGMAMMFMRRMGFKEVYNLSGGTIAWKQDGKPLVR